ncbi:MAG: M42 family peptidase, partial [Clostridia bacterium]|nr:M42 family peptidase [Clostridia bacterium]
VETTTAADIPEVDEAKRVCTLGEGAVISFMDRRTIYDKAMYNEAFRSAKRTGVKVQAKRAVAGGNDSGVISTSKGGVRTIAVSLPCRYLHSPHTVAYKEDINAVFGIVCDLAEAAAGGKL